MSEILNIILIFVVIILSWKNYKNFWNYRYWRCKHYHDDLGNCDSLALAVKCSFIVRNGEMSLGVIGKKLTPNYLKANLNGIDDKEN
jgi:hypothetical protein